MFRDDERCSSTYTDCNEKLFEYLSSSYQIKTAWPFSSDLYDQQGIFAQTTDTGLKNRKYKFFTVFHFFFFRPFSGNPKDDFVKKIQVNQQFLQHSDQLVWH